MVRQGGYDPATGRRRVRQLGTFPTKRGAVEYQRALSEGRLATDQATLKNYLEQVWLPSKDGRVEVSTLDQYTWAVRRQIVPLLGAVRRADFTTEVLDDWVRELVAVGESGKPRLGPTSARLVRKVLSMGLEEAVQRGRLARSPVQLTQPPRRDRTYKKLGWTLDEARRSSTPSPTTVSLPPSMSLWSPGCGAARSSPCGGWISTSTTISSSSCNS